MTTPSLMSVWPIIVSIVLVIAWIIRLESKVMYLDRESNAREERHEKEFEEIKAEHMESKTTVWAKMDDIQKTMTEILISLSKIQGNLERSHKGDQNQINY